MDQYDHKKIEQKWARQWRDTGIYKTPRSTKKKRYILDMYPYPSGDGLHVGHVEGYTATDIYSRYLRMNGYSVLHPMGWDAFGLPAENYAIKTGVHPRETTQQAIDNFREQINALGFSYDWDREVGTHNPDYYRWTQWFFLLLFERGLAYREKAKVNWCESCKTVLANEQVINGCCERCKHEVIQKDLEQWFFKIRDYADQLIDDLKEVDWPDSTKINQKNWIGRSEGAHIQFPIVGTDEQIEVFTTRADTLFGATYVVLAPEHTLVDMLQSNVKNWEAVTEYRISTKKKTELERISDTGEKTGVVLEGVTAVNPASKKEIPVFIADYVLAEYGTGAIMAVPAHDERDYAFAEEHNLPIQQVISAPEQSLPYSGEGTLLNSGKFEGMESGEVKEAIVKEVGGAPMVNYKLRDWLVSRQRYWGAPIPIVYDPSGRPHPIPEEYLPWELPTDVEFLPTGVSPLAQSKELLERTERIFGKGWKPEADTLDTFVCSSWYFFRFVDSKNNTAFADRKKIDDWLPIDLYMGGVEHTVLHLMYARFFTKVLRDAGHIDFGEPFLKLRHQGVILAEDGRKMSKSLGNVLNPDEVVERYGADTLRLFEMFMGPLEDMKPWNSESIVGVRRFLDKLWRLCVRVAEQDSATFDPLLHETIKKVSEDIESLKFNTAISQLMICVNGAEKEGLGKNQFELLVRLVAPFAPFLAEELWAFAKNTTSVHAEGWPEHDAKLLEINEMTIAVQVNGKTRGSFIASKDSKKKDILEEAQSLPNVTRHIESGVDRAIYIPGKLVNLVTKGKA